MRSRGLAALLAAAALFSLLLPAVSAATCRPGFTGAGCAQCVPGHYGSRCLPCQCENGGICDDGRNGQGTCACPAQFDGVLCDDCAPDYFGEYCLSCQCNGHGTCDDGYYGSGICTCDPGWYGNRCERDIDPSMTTDMTLSQNVNGETVDIYLDSQENRTAGSAYFSIRPERPVGYEDCIAVGVESAYFRTAAINTTDTGFCSSMYTAADEEGAGSQIGYQFGDSEQTWTPVLHYQSEAYATTQNQAWRPADGSVSWGSSMVTLKHSVLYQYDSYTEDQLQISIDMRYASPIIAVCFGGVQNLTTEMFPAYSQAYLDSIDCDALGMQNIILGCPVLDASLYGATAYSVPDVDSADYAAMEPNNYGGAFFPFNATVQSTLAYELLFFENAPNIQLDAMWPNFAIDAWSAEVVLQVTGLSSVLQFFAMVLGGYVFGADYYIAVRMFIPPINTVVYVRVRATGMNVFGPDYHGMPYEVTVQHNGGITLASIPTESFFVNASDVMDSEEPTFDLLHQIQFVPSSGIQSAPFSPRLSSGEEAFKDIAHYDKMFNGLLGLRPMDLNSMAYEIFQMAFPTNPFMLELCAGLDDRFLARDGVVTNTLVLNSSVTSGDLFTLLRINTDSLRRAFQLVVYAGLETNYLICPYIVYPLMDSDFEVTGGDGPSAFGLPVSYRPFFVYLTVFMGNYQEDYLDRLSSRYYGYNASVSQMTLYQVINPVPTPDNIFNTTTSTISNAWLGIDLGHVYVSTAPMNCSEVYRAMWNSTFRHAQALLGACTSILAQDRGSFTDYLRFQEACSNLTALVNSETLPNPRAVAPGEACPQLDLRGELLGALVEHGYFFHVSTTDNFTGTPFPAWEPGVVVIVAWDTYDPDLFCGYMQRYWAAQVMFGLTFSATQRFADGRSYSLSATASPATSTSVNDYFNHISPDSPCTPLFFLFYDLVPNTRFLPGAIPQPSSVQLYSATAAISYVYRMPVTGVGAAMLDHITWMDDMGRPGYLMELHDANGNNISDCDAFALSTAFYTHGNLRDVADMLNMCYCECVHGICDRVASVCLCDDGWTGNFCQTPSSRYAVATLFAPSEDFGGFGTAVAFWDNVLYVASYNKVVLYNCSGLICIYATSVPLVNPAAVIGESSIAVTNGTVAVGAPGDLGGAGSVYVFDCDTVVWSCTHRTVLQASVINSADRFGTTVAFMGRVLVVGSEHRGGTDEGGFESFVCAQGAPDCTSAEVYLYSDGFLKGVGRQATATVTTLVDDAGFAVLAGGTNETNLATMLYICQNVSGVPACITQQLLRDDTRTRQFGSTVAAYNYVIVLATQNYTFNGDTYGGFWVYSCGLVDGGPGLVQCNDVAGLVTPTTQPNAGMFAGRVTINDHSVAAIGSETGWVWLYVYDPQVTSVTPAAIIRSEYSFPASLAQNDRLIARGFPGAGFGIVEIADCPLSVAPYCTCDTGFTGDACTDCAPGFFGPYCEPCECSTEQTCNDGFSGDGTCSCPPGTYGDECANCTCQRGTCNDGANGDGTCTTCEANFFGPDCDQCAYLHYGENCQFQCESDCNFPAGGGSCNWGVLGNGACYCFTNYYGVDCEFVLPHYDQLLLVDPDGSPGEAFGYAVAIDGNIMAITSLLPQAFFLYECNATACSQRYKYTYTDGSDLFGASVAISGPLVVVGAPSYDVMENMDEGKVIVFHCNYTAWNCSRRASPLTMGAYSNNANRFGLQVVTDGYLVAASQEVLNGYEGDGAFFAYYCLNNGTCAQQPPWGDGVLLPFNLGRSVGMGPSTLPNTTFVVIGGDSTTGGQSILVAACTHAPGSQVAPTCSQTTLLSGLTDSAGFRSAFYRQTLVLAAIILPYQYPAILTFACNLTTVNGSYVPSCYPTVSGALSGDAIYNLLALSSQVLVAGRNDFEVVQLAVHDAASSSISQRSYFLGGSGYGAPTSFGASGALVALGYGNTPFPGPFPTGVVVVLRCNTSFEGPACRCAEGWAGDSCNACAPFHYGESCTPCTACNRTGFTCSNAFTGDGSCVCLDGYYGVNCTECACNGHGSCDDGSQGTGVCTCFSDYWGVNCSLPCACEHGACDQMTGACSECDGGWAGDNCDLCLPGYWGAECAQCSLDCGDYGVCDDGVTGTGNCVCDSDHYNRTDTECGTGENPPCCTECYSGHWGAACYSCQCLNGGACNEGATGDGSCACIGAWVGDVCDSCASGFAIETYCTTCSEGYYLSDDECLLCDECVHGTCGPDGACVCSDGWTGPLCDDDASGSGSGSGSGGDEPQIKVARVVVGHNATTLAHTAQKVGQFTYTATSVVTGSLITLGALLAVLV